MYLRYTTRKKDGKVERHSCRDQESRLARRSYRASPWHGPV